MNSRPLRIDGELRKEHYYLTEDDECFYFGEYFPHSGFSAGPINNLISNFQKSVDRRGRSDWIHKENAITEIGRLVRDALSAAALPSLTFVPMPPSRARNDPLHDDRAARALRSVMPPLDVRELVVMRSSVRSHKSYQQGEKRPTPSELKELMAVEDSLCEPKPKKLIIFDDVITNGTHFRACKEVLLERFPDINVVGLFIGRRKLQSAVDEFESLD